MERSSRSRLKKEPVIEAFRYGRPALRKTRSMDISER